VSAAALDSIVRVVERGGDADDVLRRALDVLVQEPAIAWAAIRFREEERLVLGPSSGKSDEARRTSTTIVYHADAVGELLVDGDADPALLEGVATLLGPYVLLGWDTDGETWDP
jgi:hypothetical protein